MENEESNALPWDDYFFLFRYWAPTGKRIPAPRKWVWYCAWFLVLVVVGDYGQNHYFFLRCRYCEWSRSGGLKKPQPDNRLESFHLMSSISLPPPHFYQHREAKQGGKDEGCIGILNDFYSDGIKWHDIECRHKKPIICQVETIVHHHDHHHHEHIKSFPIQVFSRFQLFFTTGERRASWFCFWRGKLTSCLPSFLMYCIYQSAIHNI